MTAGRPVTVPPARTRSGDALLDGIPAGVAGAAVILLGFLALDLAGGRAFHTPTLIGGLLLGEPPGAGPPGPAELSAGVAGILLESMLVGALVTWLLTRSRRTPAVGSTLVASFVALQLAFHALDALSGAGLFAQLRPWAVLTAHALAATAMALVLRKRWPRLTEGRRDLWDDEP